MAGYANVWPKGSAERALQTRLGRVIAEQLGAPESVPERLRDLLERLGRQRDEPQRSSH